jgi:hypothetical protein
MSNMVGATGATGVIKAPEDKYNNYVEINPELFASEQPVIQHPVQNGDVSLPTQGTVSEQFLAHLKPQSSSIGDAKRVQALLAGLGGAESSGVQPLENVRDLVMQAPIGTTQIQSGAIHIPSSLVGSDINESSPATSELVSFLNKDGKFENLNGDKKREILTNYAEENGLTIPLTILTDANIEHLTQEQALLLLQDSDTKEQVTSKPSVPTKSFKMGDQYSEDAFRLYMDQFSPEQQRNVLENTLKNLFMDVRPDDATTSNKEANENQKHIDKKIADIMKVYDAKGFDKVVGEIFVRKNNKIKGQESFLYTEEKIRENLF